MTNTRKLAAVGLSTLVGLAPIPGLSLLMNKRVRKTAKRAAGAALVGAGVLVTVPLALYVICRTSGESARKN